MKALLNCKFAVYTRKKRPMGKYPMGKYPMEKYSDRRNKCFVEQFKIVTRINFLLLFFQLLNVLENKLHPISSYWLPRGTLVVPTHIYQLQR